MIHGTSIREYTYSYHEYSNHISGTLVPEDRSRRITRIVYIIICSE